MPTKIQWCDEVWNPVTGCSKVSPGCLHCYAERMSHRLKGRFGYPEDEPFRVTFHPDKLEQPLGWKKPRRVFVVSMGDLFHEHVKFNAIHKIWDVMKQCPQHIFMVLTKRPERMLECVNKVYSLERMGAAMGFWSHVALGVTAENQQTADERIPILLQIPAARRFVSIEPMLSNIQLNFEEPDINQPCPDCNQQGCEKCGNVGYRFNSLDWVIVGGLSLPGGKIQAPPREWLDSIVEQCSDAGVPIFIKDNAQYPIQRTEFPK